MFSPKLIWHLQGRLAYQLNQLRIRPLTVASGSQSLQKPKVLEEATIPQSRVDNEWLQAKDYDAIPGPSKWKMLSDFLPGGKMHNKNLIEMNQLMREEYGDIYRIRGVMGKPDFVFTYNPEDIELTYRNEGIWPIRIGLESFAYYRKEKRPDVFHGIDGLVTAQGKPWADIRNKVNPVLMKVQNIRQSLPQIDQISSEFITKLDSLRDPSTNQLTSNFHEELKMWAFESISYIALNTRMGLMTDRPDRNARRLAENMADFFQFSFDYDVVPSFWKYVETPGFKRLIRNFDNITEITTNYIDAAIRKFESEGNREAQSVLEKLCRIDKQVAIVMAMDMLMAGIDTTSSAFVTILYLIAKNPEKQEALRRELLTVMPHATTPLSADNTKNMPYLRACIKEGLRITPITPGNLRITIKDLVLSGYKVPKDVGVVMNVMALANTEAYFPRSSEFLPERWLKSGQSACPAAKATNPFIYLPFGFGARTCIGKRIAEMEIETLMAKIIRNYRVSWDSEEDLNYISNIILVPHGNMPFKFEPV